MIAMKRTNRDWSDMLRHAVRVAVALAVVTIAGCATYDSTAQRPSRRSCSCTARELIFDSPTLALLSPGGGASEGFYRRAWPVTNASVGQITDYDIGGYQDLRDRHEYVDGSNRPRVRLHRRVYSVREVSQHR